MNRARTCIGPFRWMRMIAGITLIPVLCSQAAEPASTNVPLQHVLLLDSLGRVVGVRTNELDSSVLPPADIGLKRQIPNSVEGRSLPEEVMQRLSDAHQGVEEFQFFPAVPPPLMPYLASFDEHGNTALRPGALFPLVPQDPFVQGAKYWLGDKGLRYSLEQSFTAVGMSDVMKGSSTLAFYTFNFKAKWAVLEAPATGTAGWISAQVEAKSGLGGAGGTESPKLNVGC